MLSKTKTKLFEFAKPGHVKQPERSPRVPKLTDPADQPPFFVRGQKAGSKDEYWTSLALEKIEKMTGWGWDYQVPLNGGRRRRGGNVADFIVYAPIYYLLDPMGRVWHTGHREDRFEMQNGARERGWILIAWFTDQTPTKESVYQLLRKEMHI